MSMAHTCAKGYYLAIKGEKSHFVHLISSSLFYIFFATVLDFYLPRHRFDFLSSAPLVVIYPFASPDRSSHTFWWSEISDAIRVWPVSINSLMSTPLLCSCLFSGADTLVCGVVQWNTSGWKRFNRCYLMNSILRLLIWFTVQAQLWLVCPTESQSAAVKHCTAELCSGNKRAVMVRVRAVIGQCLRWYFWQCFISQIRPEDNTALRNEHSLISR